MVYITKYILPFNIFIIFTVNIGFKFSISTNFISAVTLTKCIKIININIIKDDLPIVSNPLFEIYKIGIINNI